MTPSDRTPLQPVNTVTFSKVYYAGFRFPLPPSSDAFVERLFANTFAALNLLLVYLGDRLGYYRASTADVHATLDRAVWAAYGWDDPDPATVDDDTILARLLAFNLERAGPGSA